jgi:hypothetical protein
MNRLTYRIRERKHHERTSRTEVLMLAVCIAGVVLAVALSWAREENRGDCYFSTGREVEIGKWKHVGGEQMACVKK